MKLARLEDMVGGWFIGDFSPSVLRTADVEVSVKAYRAGEVDAEHVHRIATEVTVIVSGEAQMGGHGVRAGDIVVLEPGDVSGFTAVTDCHVVAVKLPSVVGDKHVVKAEA